MKGALAVISLIAAVMAVCIFYGRNITPAKPVDVTHGSQARQNAVTINIDHQKKCTEKARDEFRRAGWDHNRLAKFFAHYSETLNRCFIEFDLIIADAGGDADVIRSLSDAEGREYGTFAEATSQGGRQSGTSPTICEVALSSGEEIECSSLEQFNEYTKGYMGNSREDVNSRSMSR